MFQLWTRYMWNLPALISFMALFTCSSGSISTIRVCTISYPYIDIAYTVKKRVSQKNQNFHALEDQQMMNTDLFKFIFYSFGDFILLLKDIIQVHLWNTCPDDWHEQSSISIEWEKWGWKEIEPTIFRWLLKYYYYCMSYIMRQGKKGYWINPCMWWSNEFCNYEQVAALPSKTYDWICSLVLLSL